MKKLISPLLFTTILFAIMAFTIKNASTDSGLPPDQARGKLPDYRLQPDTVQFPEETHFKNVQQLTFGGDNAEAYWSYDSKYLVFQRTNPKEGLNCDQIFIGKIPENPGDKFE